MMIKTPLIPEKIHDVICNKCGKSCTYMKYIHNYASIQPNFGYGSSFDGLFVEEMHLCETCFDEFKSTCKIPPKIVDPYEDWVMQNEDL